MIQNRTPKGAALNALIALILTSLFFVGIHLLYTFTYGVVDDPFIATVLNGAYTGTPDAHVVYIKYPLAWILTMLFTWFPQVNWHFLLLVSCFQICCFVVCFRICSNVNKIRNKLFLSILFLLLFWLTMGEMVLTVHYSMCAAVLSATGIFYFGTIPRGASRKNLALNFLAVLLMLWTAYAIRARTLFMLLPLAGGVFIYLLFREKPVFRKKNLIRWLFCPVVLFIGLGGLELMHNANYKSELWQEFLTFNDARTTLYDFYGLPEYEKNKEFYEQLNISKARDYVTLEKYYLELRDGMDPDALPQIADYRVKESKETLPTGKRIIESIKALPLNLVKKTYAPVNWIVAACFLILLLASILLKKWRALAALILCFVGSLIPWLWMIYVGKPTPRVTMGIWAADLLFFAALLIDHADEIRSLFAGSGKEKKKWAGPLAFGVFTAALLAGIVVSYAPLTKKMDTYIASGRVRASLESWCEEHLENLYILESEIVNGLGFDRKAIDNSLMNLMWPGGWTAKMEANQKIYERFGFSDVEKAIVKEDNIYIVAFSETDMDYWLRFYRETYPDAVLKAEEELLFDQKPFTVYSIQER